MSSPLTSTPPRWVVTAIVFSGLLLGAVSLSGSLIPLPPQPSEPQPNYGSDPVAPLPPDEEVAKLRQQLEQAHEAGQADQKQVEKLVAQFRSKAEAASAKKNYFEARRYYEALLGFETETRKADDSEESVRQLRYEWANARWRELMGTTQQDRRALQEPEKWLRAAAENKRDQLAALAWESLGDYQYALGNYYNFSQPLASYSQALAIWAEQDRSEEAREAYLRIVFKPVGQEALGRFTFYNQYWDIDTLRNAVDLAKSKDEVARANLMFAQGLMRNPPARTPQGWKLIRETFEKALASGRTASWYDDVLYAFANWTEQQGRLIETDPAEYEARPDFENALKLYRRLTSEFSEGQSRWWDDSKRRIENITQPELNLGGGNAFYPESLINFSIASRNTDAIKVAIRKLDLVKAFTFEGLNQSQYWSATNGNDVDALPTNALGETVRSFEVKPEYEAKHESYSLEKNLEALPAGAYALIAESGKTRASRFMLVTSKQIAQLSAGDGKVLLYTTDARSGEPEVAENVTLLRHYVRRDRQANRRVVETVQAEARTNEDGTWLGPVPELPERASQSGLVVVAMIGGEPALLTRGNLTWGGNNLRDKVVIYTDRPAYRPGDTAKYKFIARLSDDSSYTTPKGARVEVIVKGPRGDELLKTEVELDEYGSASGEFGLPDDAALGAYQMFLQVWKPVPGVNDSEAAVKSGRWHGLGSQVLFRIEEYKLPEFRVAVEPPKTEQGEPKVFRMGDKVEASIKVEYYSGGAVADADVNYVIKRKRFYGENPFPEPYPWFYRGFSSSLPWETNWWAPRQEEQVTQGETKTDASGEAVVKFDTPLGDNQDWEYIVEARVTDASRRQVSGRGSVKVTRAPFFIHVKSESRVVEPGGVARLEAKAVDANDNPKEGKATLVVEREFFVTKYKENSATKDRRLIFRGYESEEVERRDVAFDADGQLKFEVKMPKEGYYRIRLASPRYEKGDKDKPTAELPNRAVGETRVFACTADTSDLGYRHGSLQIIPDRTTYAVGDTARLIVITPPGGKAALITVDGDGLIEHRVTRFDRTARLVEFTVTEAWQPNIFVGGLMIKDGRVNIVREELVVPPEENYLEVTVKPREAVVKPGAKGQVDLLVKDSKGQPVAASVSLGVVDSSIYTIQPDNTPDLREYFYGDKRGMISSPVSMLNRLRPVLIKPKEETEGEWKEVTVEGDFRDGLKGGTTAATGAGADSFEVAASRLKEVRFMRRGSARSGHRQMVAAMAGEPMAEAVMMDKAGFAAVDADGEGGAGDGTGSADIVVRSDFRETAFWQPTLTTNAEGKAVAEFDYPESLTEWKAVARAVTTGNQFGNADATAQTRQPIMVRLQTPRFLVEGDSATLSAVVINGTDKPTKSRVSIIADGLGMDRKGPERLTLKPDTQARADKNAKAVKGDVEATVTATVESPAGTDAMKLTLPVVEHGIEKFEARSLVIGTKPGEREQVGAETTLTVPKERKKGSTTLTIQLAPSLASTALDALPYLADYPYGCVEQTLSRFVPAAITAQTLKKLGLEPEAVAGRVFGGIEPGVADKLEYEKGDLAKLDEMVEKGLARLKDMQSADGGWGWWKTDQSNPFMTAYVVQGLSLAREAGVEVDDSMIVRGARWLENQLVEFEDEPDMAAWLLYALSLSETKVVDKRSKAFAKAYEQRDKLNAYTRSLLALALTHSNERVHAGGGIQLGLPDAAKTLVENLENGVVETKSESRLIGAKGSATMPTTAHWGEDGVHYRWSSGGVEATAFALRAMLAVDPSNKRVDQAARWLINNRRGAQWKNTRDTAITILSLLEYMQVRKETEPDYSVEVVVNGKTVQTVTVGKADALGVLKLAVPEEALKDGENTVAFKLDGTGRLYASAYLTYFTKEVPITAAGNELYVKREYYRVEETPRLIAGVNRTLTPLKDGDALHSGDEIQVRLILEAKNDFEYLIIEDKKPAGAEATSVQSGQPIYAVARRSDGEYAGSRTSMYQELRDQHVAFFITRLEQGFHQISYTLRAETPGTFHALPTMSHAMYVPEIRGNGDEVRITIKDKE